ncbi:hypothetical protein [Ktedonospora formicarum]|uniref:Uncharacterized protein n=1 Tax=Ktedonospora formicarum TaxID=2778364 RepID=A0A8J3MTS8_9CHLR|nr:hypothetical protein [Ktedonospora formicarum]GHO48522.1 hypothetical protein KSX_66850 [Ktedonospora formicarum]
MRDTKSTFSQRCARCLIRWYPTRWRNRYAEEMLLILEDAPPTFTTLFNLLFSLCDAYLHQDLVRRKETDAVFSVQRDVGASMKYIEAATILLGLLIGALVGSLIPLYDGNAAIFGALLVPGLGLLVLFFVKRRRKAMSLEERNRQNQLMHQRYVGSAESKAGQMLFLVEKFFHK